MVSVGTNGQHAPALRTPGAMLLPANQDFYTKFNRAPFCFDHGLAGHPLFEPGALLKLSERIPKVRDFVYWQNGRVKVDDDWGTNPDPRLTLAETVDGIATNNSLVILKHAEQDPIYGPLLQDLLQRFYSLASPEVQSDIVLGESLIFINSPLRTTPYHFDLESSFLLQIAGVKHVHAFSCDRSLTTHLEVENHCVGEKGAVYKPERQADSNFYVLTPGKGVHFPSTGPHWVENSDQVSISININFDHLSIHHRMCRIYRVNHLLRRFGVQPSPPGVSPIMDELKSRAVRGIVVARDAVRQLVRKPDIAESYPVWRPSRS